MSEKAKIEEFKIILLDLIGKNNSNHEKFDERLTNIEKELSLGRSVVVTSYGNGGHITMRRAQIGDRYFIIPI